MPRSRGAPERQVLIHLLCKEKFAWLRVAGQQRHPRSKGAVDQKIIRAVLALRPPHELVANGICARYENIETGIRTLRIGLNFNAVYALRKHFGIVNQHWRALECCIFISVVPRTKPSGESGRKTGQTAAQPVRPVRARRVNSSRDCCDVRL